MFEVGNSRLRMAALLTRSSFYSSQSAARHLVPRRRRLVAFVMSRLVACPFFNLGEALTRPGIHGLARRIDKSWLPNPPQAAAQNLKLRDVPWALIEPAFANTVSTILAPP
jgi:hypothetical protein